MFSVTATKNHDDVHRSNSTNSSKLLRKFEDRTLWETLDWFGRVCLQWRDGLARRTGTEEPNIAIRISSSILEWHGATKRCPDDARGCVAGQYCDGIWHRLICHPLLYGRSPTFHITARIAKVCSLGLHGCLIIHSTSDWVLPTVTHQSPCSKRLNNQRKFVHHILN